MTRDNIVGTLHGNSRLSGGLSVGGGVTDYNELENRPSINGHILEGDQTSEDLGIDIITPFIDTDDHIATNEYINNEIIPDYTAVKNCYMYFYVFGKNGNMTEISLDNELVARLYFQGDDQKSCSLYVKAGQTISFNSFNYYNTTIIIYGLQ